MKLYSVNTGYFKLDGGAMFGVVPKSMWNKLNPADENNLCSWAMRCLLIEDGNKLILVDNGIGDKQDAKFMSHYYLHGDDSLDKSLNNLGFSKDDITDVFLTHLHFDHCGGSIKREGEKFVPAFKNAIYWSNAVHWDNAVHPNQREKASFLKENILPIKESGQLQFIHHPYSLPQQEETLNKPKLITLSSSFDANIDVRFADGHTAGMMLPQINYKGRTIVFMADLLPSVAHLPLPYVMAYDMRPIETLSERELFWKEAADNDYIFFLEHDKDFECCSLQMTEKGVRAKETFALSELG